MSNDHPKPTFHEAMGKAKLQDYKPEGSGELERALKKALARQADAHEVHEEKGQLASPKTPAAQTDRENQR